MMLYNGNTNGATRDLGPEPRLAPRFERSTTVNSTANTARSQRDELRRAAFRAAKMLDRLLVKSDPLLAGLEQSFAQGTDDDLAAAVLSVVQRAEAA